MIPTSFDESTGVLSAPKGISAKDCGPLSVYQNGALVISCWKMTQSEREEFLKTGRIWLTILGESMPPAVLTVQSPFALKKT